MKSIEKFGFEMAENKTSGKELLKSAKRVVIKIGSGVLTVEDGLNTRVMDDLATDISALRESGKRWFWSPQAPLQQASGNWE